MDTNQTSMNRFMERYTEFHDSLMYGSTRLSNDDIRSIKDLILSSSTSSSSEASNLDAVKYLCENNEFIQAIKLFEKSPSAEMLPIAKAIMQSMGASDLLPESTSAMYYLTRHRDLAGRYSKDEAKKDFANGRELHASSTK